ncbi:ABC transporter permease [Mucisphaera sp.]|uniref:ABC transporter permease n=1 Tax=Mucisphaera sp. TaxID=2913024 RepID=UPI003D0BC098
MSRLILFRLLQMPLILAVIFLVTFTLAWVVPGNPLERPEGQRPPPEVQEAMARQYNLHSPWAFLSSYVSNVVVGSEQYGRLDFGPSLRYTDQRVSSIIGQALPVSAALGLAALAVALFLGTLAGVIGALKPGSWLDMSSLMVALIGVSLPNFVTGSILLILFAGLLDWFPVGGWGRPEHLVLPAIALGFFPAAYVARLVRLGLADVMSSDYVRTARAKGLSHVGALFKHALKVAYLPVLSFMGPAAASVMTGSFVIEKVFAIPGMGDYFVNAVLNKDQFLILGVVLTYSTMLVVFNLLVDVAYAWIDPRIEL